jgi:alpha-tubulin suppressor-like RCC1 family protein
MKHLMNTLGAGLLLAILGCGEETQAPRDPESASGGEPALATAAAAALSFEQVSPGYQQTCGVTTDHRAYCWGNPLRLGDGGGRQDGRRPVAVAGEHQWLLVSSGFAHVCGVTTEHVAYCWGDNSANELGDGTKTDRLAPVPVLGGLLFKEVDAGLSHTCGVSYPDNRAYCWGYNGDGRLGDGTTIQRSQPVPVAGTLRFRQVRAGYSHTCGVTTENRIHCWGNNRLGQLGDSTEVQERHQPTLVAGGRQYRQVDAGGEHNCAVTTGNQAFCWGNGRRGQIGNGRYYLSFWPRAVAGGFQFERVSAGEFHTCGETTLNRAYCWGQNSEGELGDGSNSTSPHATPVAVTGGHFFSQVSAGGMSTCGRTDAAVAYCWGLNQYGQLGDGTTTNRWSPTAVLGPS